MVNILQAGDVENLGKETRPLDKATSTGVYLAQSEGQLADVFIGNVARRPKGDWLLYPTAMKRSGMAT